MNIELTQQEKEALDLTNELWEKIIKLPVLHDMDNQETCRDIHNIQNRLLARSAMVKIKKA